MLPLAANLRRLILSLHKKLRVARPAASAEWALPAETSRLTERERIPAKSRVSSGTNWLGKIGSPSPLRRTAGGRELEQVRQGVQAIHPRQLAHVTLQDR
jgi:hypothetical protein